MHSYLKWGTLAFLLMGLHSLAVPSLAQPPPTLLWSYPGIENVVCVTWVPDIDGDGGPDIVFESFYSGAPPLDNLYAIQGRSSGVGNVIWSARPLGGPSNSGGYGDNCLRISPDLNGDATPDVIIGMAWGNRSAFALDGLSGTTEWSFDTYVDTPPDPPVSGWIYAMDSLGQDITDDGIPEVVFCTGSDNDGAYCVSGADGAVIWRYQGGDAMFDIRSIDDLNGDGVRDVIAGMGDNVPRVIALSGAGGPGGSASVIWYRDSGSVFSIARLPDQDGDDVPEVVTGTWDNQIHCYSGRTGGPLWNGAVGDYVMRVAVLDDVDGDDYPDVAVGSWDNAARVYSGIDGSLIWRRPVGTLNGGDVWAIDGVGDITGDGVSDVCCGSFDTKVYLMDGVTGEIVWAYPVGNRVYTVRGVPDISGNGVPDVVAGTQMTTTGGICYAFEGGDPTITIGETPAASAEVRLPPNTPNPFQSTTEWRLQLRGSGDARLLLYGPSGRLVTTLALPSEAAAGEHVVRWDGRDRMGHPVPSGVYVVRLMLDGRVAAERKTVLVR